MKKIIVAVILIILIFFFKEDLADQYRQHFPEEQVDLPWMDRGKENIDLSIAKADFDTSIVLLQEFESKLQKEIEGIAAESNDTKRRQYRRQLICELAALYKKMAMQYLQNGQEMMYMQYIGEYRDQLQVCTESTVRKDSY